MDKKIDRLKNHYIICGYGRIGRVLCNNLSKSSLDMVVIDTGSVFLVLTARQLNPELNIIARASHDHAKAELKAAGANRVESIIQAGETVIAVGEKRNLQMLEAVLNP